MVLNQKLPRQAVAHGAIYNVTLARHTSRERLRRKNQWLVLFLFNFAADLARGKFLVGLNIGEKFVREINNEGNAYVDHVDSLVRCK